MRVLKSHSHIYQNRDQSSYKKQKQHRFVGEKYDPYQQKTPVESSNMAVRRPHRRTGTGTLDLVEYVLEYR